MMRRITAAFLLVVVLYGGFFIGAVRQLGEESVLDW